MKFKYLKPELDLTLIDKFTLLTSETADDFSGEESEFDAVG